KHKVVRVTPGGQSRDFARDGQDGLWGVLGMKVDAKGRLWVVTAAGPEAGAQEGSSAVLVYETATGAFLRRYAMDNATAHHFLNDLVLSKDGRVFVTDSRNGAVWRIDPDKDGFTAVVKPFTLDYPNGIALSVDERRLYVADYAKGVSIVDPATGAVSP